VAGGGPGRATGGGRCAGVGIIGGTMNGVDSSGVCRSPPSRCRVMLLSDFIGSACAAMLGCAAAW
jgi:hypothetical protein